ncbi:MAG: hypothetical protein HBSAPP03_11390 [Phycisphaerae bacterium]|nr:MAG: hypothetical protein HBSAPP03_11390 [Phycisphaerae bacterium]
MRSVVGILLVLIGGAVILAGLGVGLWPIIETYRANLADALGDSATAAETDLQARMLRGVWVALPGVVLMIVGKMMLKAALVRRLRGK